MPTIFGPRVSATSSFRKNAIGLVAVITVLAAVIMTTPTPVIAEEGLTEAQEAAVEGLIEQYIQEHPEVILDAVRAYNERQQAEAGARAEANLITLREQIFNDPRAPVAGNPDGDVTMVEFFDYRCSYCKKSLDMVMTMINEDPNLRVVFKEFPILSPQSRRASQAALAANEQGKYMDFHYALMSARGSYDDQQIMDIAAEVGLDVEKLQKDMEAPEITAYLDEVQDLARSLDIRGTPTFLVENQIVRGAVDPETLRKAIAEKRES
jgi:protein-disulfide isomerase